MRVFILAAALLCAFITNRAVAQSTWSTTGNAGTNPGTHFIGTTDTKDLVFKIQNIERGRIMNNGGAWRFGGSSNYAKIDGGGKLTFSGTGGYQVAANKYVYQYAGSPNIGLYYNASTTAHEFRDNNGSVAARVSALSGNGYFKGNVGIGTTSPAYKLDVSGTARVTGTLRVGSYTLPTSAGSAGQVLTSNGSGTVSWTTPTGGGSGSQWASNGTNISYSGGNVGVGITSPSYKLHVAGTGYFSGSLKVGAYTLPTSAGNAGQVLTSNGTGSVIWTTPAAGGSSQWASNGSSISYNAGNVGVGTITPSHKLEVLGTGYISGTLKVGAYTLPATDGTAGQVLTSNGAGIVSWSTVSGGGGTNPWTVNGSNISYNGGNTGLGTTNPSYKLDVSGTGRFTGTLRVGAYTLPSTDGTAGQVLSSNGSGTVSWITPATGSTPSQWTTSGSNIHYSAGNVAIGANDFAVGYKLSVSGKIMCEEVKVQLASNWPDYVFQKNYELRSLEEVERSIEANKHLPGIPSAKQIAEEGISVGDMQARMMEKIEELTLYLIDANKEMHTANTQIATLQGNIEQLQQRISELEKNGN